MAGASAATGVIAPTAGPSISADATQWSGPLPPNTGSLAAGDSFAFTYTYSAAATGNFNFTARASGTDANSGQAVQSVTGTSNAVQVVSNLPLLSATWISEIPSPATVGQDVTAVLQVKD